MVGRETEIGARRQKAMNLLLGNLNFILRPPFHKLSIVHLHLNYMGAFIKRDILGPRHPNLASLRIRPRTSLSVSHLA